MPNLNKVQLMGNLTRDPELKTTQKGSSICDIGLAINRTWSNDDGQKQEETTFVDVTFFGRQAETIDKYVHKGNPLYVEGRLKLDQWEDKQTGQSRSKMRVIGESFQFLSSGEKKDRADAPPKQDRPAPEAGRYENAAALHRGEQSPDHDDILF
jgi:single-strand DNA-binding protein